MVASIALDGAALLVADSADFVGPDGPHRLAADRTHELRYGRAHVQPPSTS